MISSIIRNSKISVDSMNYPIQIKDRLFARIAACPFDKPFGDYTSTMVTLLVDIWITKCRTLEIRFYQA
ncbi:hypothetical protein M0804_000549 [Polistes exclamans]|nr:hypothetical protein M0804_000549 [Polistes exclamans]